MSDTPDSVCACGHDESMHGSKMRACYVPVASGPSAIGVIWCSCLDFAPADAPTNPGDTP